MVLRTFPEIAESSADYFVSNNNGTAVRRIRNPHAHDVLCGRGGGINGHVGNRVFRDLVAERRLDYNLAATKCEKARVAKEVMKLVTGLSPPGRFLMRDPTGGIGSWWIEIDENKAMAKTSQALREGAPSIRAQHRDELKTITRNHGIKRSRSCNQENSGEVKKTALVTPLMSNAQFKHEFTKEPPTKPKTVTPTLMPSPSTVEIPSLYLEPVTSPPDSVHEENALTSPIISQWKTLVDCHLDEFVNPFENEEGVVNSNQGTQTVCAHCGLLVQCGKICICLSKFDPLLEICSI